jgi:hypothetical protein
MPALPLAPPLPPVLRGLLPSSSSLEPHATATVEANMTAQALRSRLIFDPVLATRVS